VRGNLSIELSEMPLLMPQVVFDEETKRDRFIFTHDAACLKAFFGDAVDDCGQNFVLRLPPAHKRIPGLAVVTVGGHPCLLCVFWTGVVAVRGGANKALAVVSGRVEQVPDDLLAGPAPDAPGRVSKRRGKGDQRGPQGAQFSAKLVSELGDHCILEFRMTFGTC
jgi:hypothetical protein